MKSDVTTRKRLPSRLPPACHGCYTWKRHQCFLAGWLNKALTFSRSVTSVFSWTTVRGCSRADFSNACTKACAFFLSVMSKFAKMLDVAIVSSSFMVLTWIKYIWLFHNVKSNSRSFEPKIKYLIAISPLSAHTGKKNPAGEKHQRDGYSSLSYY